MFEYTDDKFKQMRDAMIKHFEENMAGKPLFKIDISNRKLWNTYLNAFPDENKKIYRKTSFHDCSSCQKFFRKMGNVVALDNGGREVITLFDFKTIPEYQDVLNTLSNCLRNRPIKDVFFSNKKIIGTMFNYEQLEDNTTIVRNHFCIELPDQYVKSKTISVIADKRNDYETLMNSINELSIESLNDVVEMINQGIIYRGVEWRHILIYFRRLSAKYKAETDAAQRNHLLWDAVMNSVGKPLTHLKNHSIGALLEDLTKGYDTEAALARYEHIVAPSNYQRPKPIFTKAMLEAGKKKIEELGYLDSLQRRYATIDDISVNNTLFINRDIKKSINTDSVDDLFESLEKDAIIKPQSFKNVEKMSLDSFIADVLPIISNIEIYFEPKLRNNLVSLITSVNPDSESMFKWGNDFSWAYRNNVADSLKEKVRKAGGAVDGDLRFSIQWNNDSVWNKCDYDAHCTEPSGNEIFYSAMTSPKTRGRLDVDVIDPRQLIAAVENITYPTRKTMIDGDYLFRVHCYTARDGNDGFEAEIEFDGDTYSFDYPSSIRENDYIDVATVTLKDGVFSIKDHLGSIASSRSYWNLKANQFVPVQLMCYSPNFWEEKGYGNKHVFFMINDCINDSMPNAWFNEFLNNELHDHKKVMEALAAKACVEDNENQLSGFGFSTTMENEFIIRVDGQRVIKITL